MTTQSVLDAWRLLNEKETLKRFNFFPSLVTTVYLGGLILYQVAFTYAETERGDSAAAFFRRLLELAYEEYFFYIVVIAIVGVLTYVVTIPLSQAWLLALIDKHIRLDRGLMQASGDRSEHFYSYALSKGIIKFLPVFELNNIMVPFNLLSILSFYLFLIRILDEYIVTVSVIVGVYFLISLFVNILFAYSRYFIVFENMSAFQAIGASIEMTFDNLSETFRLYFTILLVYFRTLLAAAFFLVFPFLLFAALSYITIDYIRSIGIVALGVVFLIFLALVSHLNSVLEIFTQTVWYNTYMENKQEKTRQEGKNQETA